MRNWSWQRLGIGPKIMVATLVGFAGLLMLGAYFLGQQLRADLERVLADQATIVQKQIQVTRAYVAKNYVVKAKNAGMTTAINHAAPDAIPFPATFTRETSEELAKEGVYNARVISQTPLNAANRAQDSFEKDALAALAAGAQEFTRIDRINDKMVFRRATPDLASVKACVSCHEGKAVGDMLGAVSVQIPMDGPLAQVDRNINAVYAGIGIVGLLMVGILYGLIQKLVVKPMSHLEDMAGRAREGDLTCRMHTGSHDEIGRTIESFNHMFERVDGALHSVKAAVETITTSTAEISAGNSNLADRTSKQASALEETSASMEEMTATIKQNADNARQANQLALSAREIAEKGGAVTEQAVRAMSEINTSSRKIADIINVIDEIAFQTNLLALNAAVEAARAGEQGRGFAVVASEVRNLAQRSATAAKEIKSLINDSVQKVSDGSELVNESGHTLTEIVNSVKRVTDIISEISAASQEQAAGIDQVNKAVVEMDRSTQQNAALVEQAAASSKAMQEQAAGLQREVAFLKLTDPEDMRKHLAYHETNGKNEGSARATGVTLIPSEKSASCLPASAKRERRHGSAGSSEFVGLTTGNGHDRRKRDDDLFEEF